MIATESKLERLRRLRDLLSESTTVDAPDLLEFVPHCLIVEKETGDLIPFRLWPQQDLAMQEIEARDRLIMPKGRQVGATWCELAAMLHAGTFHGNRPFLIVRQSLEYAQDAIQRLLILAGYDPNSVPPRMRILPESTLPERWRPAVVARTTTSITFANGSRYHALAATQYVGRGLAAYWGLADELAFWPWAPQQVAALESGCARLHIVSTGAGEGDHFHTMYQNAVAGRGDYHPLFIPSDADPRRDREWYRTNVEESADPDLARREHALTPEDAFRSLEGVFFARFERARHVAQVTPQPLWPTYRAVDFGYRVPAVLWCQRAPSGQLFIVSELVPRNLTTTELARAIAARDRELGTEAVTEASFCDPAGRAANVQTAESEFEVFDSHGLRPSGAPSSIRDGCVRIMEALADPELPLVISDACPALIAALSQLKPHRTRPEIYDVDHPVHSHPADALRYLLVNVSPGAGGVGGVHAHMTGERASGF